jgi:glutamate formiminotransferase/formiminotetrahydrofolate cyclodeaminase
VIELREMTLSEFAERLASREPTPGGGSASALAGAMAAGLVAMVARNTAANPNFDDRATALEKTATEADILREELLGLVDDDAAAFDRVMAAIRLPRETPELKAARSREIQASYKAAIEPPLRVCRDAAGVLALAGRVAEQGNPNAVSDAGVAALLAASALEGAALNVEINLGSIDDESYRARTAGMLQEVRAEGARLGDEALATVRATLG